MNNDKLKELYSLGVTWLKLKIRSPLSNWLSKGAFVVGATIVSTPLLEHLVFTAVLKHTFSIDLGITVPDTAAYIAGISLIITALIHNLLFVRLSQEYAISQRDTKQSVYKELWARVDEMFDDTVRLTNLYCTDYKKSDESYALKAETAIKEALEFTRKNRPVFFSEAIYSEVCALAAMCTDHSYSFRGCINMKKSPRDDYSFALAQKSINSEYSAMKERYELICKQIREYLDGI